jgi:hypothetical protein
MFDRVLCFPREMYRTFEVVKTFQNSISGEFFLPDFAALGSYTKWWRDTKMTTSILFAVILKCFGIHNTGVPLIVFCPSFLTKFSRLWSVIFKSSFDVGVQKWLGGKQLVRVNSCVFWYCFSSLSYCIHLVIYQYENYTLSQTLDLEWNTFISTVRRPLNVRMCINYHSSKRPCDLLLLCRVGNLFCWHN